MTSKTAMTRTEQDELTRATPQQVEQVLVKGNLGELSVEGRIAYYNLVCQSMGLNPLTRPFEFITLNSKVVLYAKRDATDQLRKIHGVSISGLEKQRVDDLLVVTATASDSTGRTDSSTGVVSVNQLKGEALANAMMKAETKAKRRVTLSLCGLGFLDETEIADVNPSDPDEPPAMVHQPVRASAALQPARASAAAPPVEVEVVWPKDGNGKGHAPAKQLITTEQRKRFADVAVEHGFAPKRIKELLMEMWHINNSAEIPVEKYDEVLTYFASDGQEPVFQATNEDIPF